MIASQLPGPPREGAWGDHHRACPLDRNFPKPLRQLGRRTVPATAAFGRPNKSQYAATKCAVFLAICAILLDTYETLCYTFNMRMGRPRMLAKERQSHLIALRLTPAEHRKLEQLARKSGLSLSEFVRQALGFK